MKASKECYECLRRLALQAAGLAASDEKSRLEATEKGLKVVEDNFSYDEVTIVVATKIHDVIKMITQTPDPYRGMKDKEIAVARELCSEVELGNGGLRGCLELAALGNTIDFFKPVDVLRESLKGRANFAIDDTGQLEARIKGSSKILYLADNAGEMFFDLPHVRWMRQFTRVVYVTKALPVQNDVTLEDVRRAGLETELGEMITTGTATPGVAFSLASLQFKHEFATADLIFAKGMGYYESLSELPAEGKIFYCLMAKCQPVADSLGVPLNSYVAMFR